MIEEITKKLKSGLSLKLAYELVVSLMRFGYFHDNSDLANKALELKVALEKSYNIIDAGGFYKPENLGSGTISQAEASLVEGLMEENRRYLISHGYEFMVETGDLP